MTGKLVWGERKDSGTSDLPSCNSRSVCRGSVYFLPRLVQVWNSPRDHWWRWIRGHRGYGCQTFGLAGAFANDERSNDYIWNTSCEMEFLNGLRAQLLKLLVGKVCQQAEGCSLYNLLLLACGFSFLLAESKLLRQKAQDTGLWQSVSHSPVYMDYYNYFFGGSEAGDAFKKEFLSRGRTLLPEWNMVNIKSLYRQGGKMLYRPLRRKEYLSLCVLCSIFFPRAFFFLPSLNDLLTSWPFLPPVLDTIIYSYLQFVVIMYTML